MYIYLSKKIAIPNNTKINCLAWNKEDGYIAIGGEGGLLKVLKLDSGNDATPKTKGLTASNNLSMNQTLEGHTETIQVITWNQKHQRLTTSDQNGIIIVWMLYKGTWYEEMINNRKKSIVVGMAWNTDGSKICIIYEDGAVIVGSVDGNRIWGKELKGVSLCKVQWSPDGKLLLFALKNGNVQLYDNMGNYIMVIDIICLKAFSPIPIENLIVNMDWYNGKFGHIYSLSPTLAICYENGLLQLMCNESDTNPVIIDTKMIATYCSWNHNGSLIAVVGQQQQRDENKIMNVVQFFSPFGDHLRTLNLPGQTVTSCSWEEGSLRIALSIDSSVYFANIRPDYKWCYFKNTVVFSSCRLQKSGICVSFWDITTNQCHIRYVPALLGMAAYKDHCVLAIQVNNEKSNNQYGLLLCNTLGTPVDGKYTDIEIKYIAINSSHVVAASKNNYLLWQYKTPKSSIIQLRDFGCEIFHIDQDPDGPFLIAKDYKLPSDPPKLDVHESVDPISCVALSDKYLIIGKESGVLKQLTVPRIVVVNTHVLNVRPHKMLLNCNSTRLAVIDVTGVLTVLDITEGSVHYNVKQNTRLERRDVWSMCWASDNPQLLAVMEKTRMYIFKGVYPEEPISSSGYICSFQNLEIQGVLLDELMEIPEKPLREHFFKLEIKSLRDTRELLEKVGITEAAQFIEDNPHPRLWRLLGEAALKDLNLKVAEEAFIRSQDYSGIQFVKRLQDMSAAIRKASVAAYFKNFDEAEKLFTEEDRHDLALNLRVTLGDWFRVIQVLKNGVSAPDQLLETAYNRTADYFTHINNWSAATEYYELAKNRQKMIESYFNLQDYKSLEEMLEQLDNNDFLLKYLANIFLAEGDYLSAIRAYLKSNDIDMAIQVSVVNHQWDQALNTAKQHRIHQVTKLFIEYSDHLVKEGKISRAIEINVQAKYWFTAAKYTTKLAEKEYKKPNGSLLTVKRIYVYMGHLIEFYRKQQKTDEQIENLNDVILAENGWMYAAAFHFYMLAHKQLYARQFHDAMCTLYALQNYTSIISEEEIYSLLALAAYLNGVLSVTSKMFVKLDSLKNISPDKKTEYNKLSTKIFSFQEPNNGQYTKSANCNNCDSELFEWETDCGVCNMKFPSCVASGHSLINSNITHQICTACHHISIEKYLGIKKTCPLCHKKFTYTL